MPASLSSTSYLSRAFQVSRHRSLAYSPIRHLKLRADSAMRPTSELLVEADALLKEAGLKVQKLGNTLSPESFNMAQGLLE
jgi:hypothetical protein